MAIFFGYPSQTPIVFEFFFFKFWKFLAASMLNENCSSFDERRIMKFKKNVGHLLDNQFYCVR